MATGAPSIEPLQSDVLPPSGHPSFSPSVNATPPQSLLEAEGIPLDTFIKELDPQFICVYCKKGLRWAMQAGCGCRSCYGCLLRNIKDQSEDLQCSNCGEPFSREEIAKDNFARKRLEKCKVYCANKARGCPEQMLLKRMDTHLQQECNYAMINCMHRSKGCLARVQRNQLVQHLKEECSYRRQMCRYCSDEFVVTELELHEKECKKLVDKCPNKCGTALIHKDKLEDHINNICPLQEIFCLFMRYGCTYKARSAAVSTRPNMLLREFGRFQEMRRNKKMDLHMSESQVYHLQLITTHIITMDKHLEGLRLMRTELEEKVTMATMASQVQGMEIGGNLKHLPAKNEKHLRDLQKMIAPKMEQIDNLEDNMNKLAKQETVSQLEESMKQKQSSIETRVVALEHGRKTAGGNIASVETSSPLTMTGVTTSALAASSSRMMTIENQFGMHAVRIAEHDLRFQVLETANYEGILLWKIKDFSRRKRDADSGKTLSLYSQPFYTSRYGYKMCARVYLNGDGMGKGTHVSMFFVVMRGDYDALLPWPFRQKVTLMLLDQDTGRRHLSDSFRPDPVSSSFGRPTTEMNIASGCPLFVSQSVLSDTAYVKDNVMFIKVIVDTNEVVRP